MATLYPTRYGTRMVTLDQLKAEHHPDKMHPEFSRRLFAWLEAQGGKVGIGGSWRKTNPPKPGFAPDGMSFHQSQSFPSGSFFSAVDLVVAVPGKVHRAPYWSEVPNQGSADAKFWGVHANVGAPGQAGAESWHLQPVELDGFLGWKSAGKPDLRYNYGVIQKELKMKMVSPPIRILDTRQTGKKPVDGETITVRLPLAPTNGVFVNITAVQPSSGGYLTAWSGHVSRPSTSNLNFGDLSAICNTSWVPVAPDNSFAIYVHKSCHVVVDVQATA